jgi:hypothetical protein
MSKMDAITLAQMESDKLGITLWVYLVGGRGDRCQMTAMKNITTNGKWIPDNRIVAEIHPAA